MVSVLEIEVIDFIDVETAVFYYTDPILIKDVKR